MTSRDTPCKLSRIMVRLPASPPRDEWPSIRRAFPAWLAVMREICARHHLPASELTPAASGTNVVFTTAEHVVKLYPPIWNDAAIGEHAILEHLAGRLALDTPQPVAEGGFDAWRYLVVTRLAGIPLAEIWRTLDAATRGALAAQLGTALRELHAIPIGPLAAIPMLRHRWSRLIARPLDETIAHHRRQGVDEAWLARLAIFLRDPPALSPDRFSPVLLHGDIHHWHLLAARAHETWHLTGLIDFDDAMLGWYEYEFASPAVLMLAGDTASLQACLHAYGLTEGALSGELRRRLMVYALLNRYWGLDAMLAYGDPRRQCGTLEELERAIFPMGPAAA